MKYEQQLATKEWHDKRSEVLQVRGCKCEHCGSTERLNVHHKRYISGHMAWEYPLDNFVVLCQECHEKVHRIKKDHLELKSRNVKREIVARRGVFAAVLQFSVRGRFIAAYRSTSLAAKATGIDKKELRSGILSGTCRVGGYVWKVFSEQMKG